MTSTLEDIKTIDLEEWLTLATAPSPTKLKQGQSPDMENVWVDEKPGSVITAPGYTKVGTAPSNNPLSFIINYFKTSSGTQTFVLSDNATVWTTVDFQNFTSIVTGLASSFQLRGKVIRDKLWLTNGSDAVRTYDGTTVTVLDGTGGTPNVPKGRYIAYHDERVWIGHISSARSAVYFSSLVDSTGTLIAPDNVNAWDTTDNFLQISEGDADFLTGIFVYRSYLHFTKQYSIWRLIGYDEYTYSRIKTRASTGTRFNESIQELDSLIHLIGVDGLYVFDGEETVRISDIIDPAQSSKTAFGFNQIQQQILNNLFWSVASTSDWNTGNVPTNIGVDNSITVIPADDSQADFQAGPTQTNIDLLANPGFVQLAHQSSGSSGVNIALNQAPNLVVVSNLSTIGSASLITDGDLTNPVGFGLPTNNGGYDGYWEITLAGPVPITQIIFKSYHCQIANKIIIYLNNILVHPSAVTGAGATINGDGSIGLSGTSPVDVTVTIPNTTAQVLVAHINAITTAGLPQNDSCTINEIQMFSPAFFTTGKFVSKTLDLGIAPTNLNSIRFTFVTNGEPTPSFFAQYSSDGSSWGAELDCTSGTLTGTPLRYIRWGVNLTSDGNNTQAIDSVTLPTVYLSAVHNTAGSISQWGPFQSDYTNQSQVSYFYRTATTSGGITGATWNAIVPGGVISDPVANQYIQFRIEMNVANVNAAIIVPVITDVTINWVVGSGSQVLQNVAATYWRNRYWLACAGPGATANNTILIRGKKTFGSPWMLKNFPILSFTRYFDQLYGGSSLDGSIYKLDTGTSANGAAIDSFFQTGDFTFGGFTCNLIELLVEVERTGSWNLNVGVSIDGGNTWDDYPIDLTVSTYDTNYMVRLNVSYTTTRFRLRFRTDGIDTPFQVHRCIAFYKLASERGSIIGDYLPTPT